MNPTPRNPQVERISAAANPTLKSLRRLAQGSDDALVAGFIVRQAEFRLLRDDLARAPREGSVQHYLLIGLRGAGKTTLLKRLAVAIRRDADLADHLIALSW